MSTRELRITFVGAGNLATRLAIALHNVGCCICQVYSRTMASASKLAVMVGAQPVDKIDDINDDAQLLIFSITDKALPEIIPLVAKRNPEAVMAHTAGSMPLSLFSGHAVHHGVLYPMQTFSKAREVDFEPVPFFIEASDSVSENLLTAVAGLVSSRVYKLDSEARKHLHLAAVFACNFSNHCYALSEQLLKPYGIPFDVMLPLIDETAAKVHELSPLKAQTGPAVRYDTNVIEAQKQLLADKPLMQEIYDVISRSIHHFASEQDCGQNNINTEK